MAFALAGFNPGMQPGGRGAAPVLHSYYTTDTLATALASGYFNSLNGMFTSGYDEIYIRASDGATLAKVTVTSGVVTLTPTQFSGGVDEATTSTATTLAATGVSNLVATQALTFTLAAPYPGAVKTLVKSGGTTTIVTVKGPTTTVTFDGTNTRLAFDLAAEAVHLVGLSATRWVIDGNVGGVVSTST